MTRGRPGPCAAARPAPSPGPGNSPDPCRRSSPRSTGSSRRRPSARPAGSSPRSRGEAREVRGAVAARDTELLRDLRRQPGLRRICRLLVREAAELRARGVLQAELAGGGPTGLRLNGDAVERGRRVLLGGVAGEAREDLLGIVAGDADLLSGAILDLQRSEGGLRGLVGGEASVRGLVGPPRCRTAPWAAARSCPSRARGAGPRCWCPTRRCRARRRRARPRAGGCSRAPAPWCRPGSVGRLQDDGDAALEVEAERRLQPAGEQAGQRGDDERADEDDRQPEPSGAFHASSAPLIINRNRQSSVSAAWRHICIRPRKISKYSMTWLISVSMVSSRVTVRASESTRRKHCSAA